MRAPDLPLLRLSRQHVAGARPSSPVELVRGMVALQAQDFIMSRWAVGVRAPRASDRTVLSAFDDGALIRTHLLRPTWHLVAAEDLRWLLALTAPQIKARAASRDRQLELTDKVYAKSNRILERALRDGERPREELVRTLVAARIPVDDNRAAHLFMRAELDGVICSGPTRRGVPTYALLDTRVAAAAAVPREEALASLASRYFASRGPATVEDFAWWSGLAARDARRAAESVKGSLSEVRVGSVPYLAATDAAPRRPARGADGVHLLPAYDEFMISYADRQAMLARVHVKKTISDNGIFRPIVVHAGLVVGLWTRRRNGGSAAVEVSLFGRQGRETRAGVTSAARRLFAFWGDRETEILFRSAS